MLERHDRALKEWALACEALRRGEQLLLIRKGGIREEEGVFRVDDREFFLLPTREHQDPALLQPRWRAELDQLPPAGLAPQEARIDTYAEVDSVHVADDEERLYRLESAHIWNRDYVRLRLDFNPYDPLYVLLLRVFRLPEAVILPWRPEYGGCRSWVTLERPISTASAEPALSDSKFEARKSELLRLLTAV